MQVALIVMTILGCDDTASQCHYVATEQHQWTSVELCRLDTEKTLGAYTSRSAYPTLVAVCKEEGAPPSVAAGHEDAPAATPPASVIEKTGAEKVAEEGLARRAFERAKAMVPSRDGVTALAGKPVTFVADGYRWAVGILSK